MAIEEQYRVDAGNLLVFDPGFFRDDCLEQGRIVVQALVKRLFDLPFTADKLGRLVALPAPSTRLPREKPLPKPRVPTKWEQFAQKKGIRKRKRSKLAFDDSKDEWRRRYGYKRVNDESEVPIIEAKDSAVPGEDPFAQKYADKRQRILKQENSRLANLKKTAKVGGQHALPSTVQLAATSFPISGVQEKSKRSSKDAISFSASLASTSTASIGKFDKKALGEKPVKHIRKHRKFLPVVGGKGNSSKEKQQLENVLSKVIASHDHDVLNINKAVTSYKLGEEAKESKDSNRGKKSSNSSKNKKKFNNFKGKGGGKAGRFGTNDRGRKQKRRR